MRLKPVKSGQSALGQKGNGDVLGKHYVTKEKEQLSVTHMAGTWGTSVGVSGSISCDSWEGLESRLPRMRTPAAVS